MKKKWALILRVVVSIAGLAGLVYGLQGKFGEALEVVRKGLVWQWFLLAIGVYAVGLGVISRRFQLILHMQGVKLDFLKSFYVSFLGLFFNLFFPSALGGDIAKGYFVYEYSGKKLGSLTGVILDRLLGFFTIVLVALAALLAYSRNFAIAGMVLQSLVAMLGFLVLGIFFFSHRGFAQKFQFLKFLIPSKKWRENLSDFYHAIRGVKDHKRVLLLSLGVSLGAQILFFASNYLLARSLGLEISVWIFFVLMPLIFFVSMAPSLSGLGVREAGFIFFFQPFMPKEEAFALCLLYDILFYGSALLAGLLFALKGGLRREVIHDLEAAEKLPEVGYGGE